MWRKSPNAEKRTCSAQTALRTPLSAGLLLEAAPFRASNQDSLFPDIDQSFFLSFPSVSPSALHHLIATPSYRHRPPVSPIRAPTTTPRRTIRDAKCPADQPPSTNAPHTQLVLAIMGKKKHGGSNGKSLSLPAGSSTQSTQTGSAMTDTSLSSKILVGWRMHRYDDTVAPGELVHPELAVTTGSRHLTDADVAMVRKLFAKITSATQPYRADDDQRYQNLRSRWEKRGKGREAAEGVWARKADAMLEDAVRGDHELESTFATRGTMTKDDWEKVLRIKELDHCQNYSAESLPQICMFMDCVTGESLVYSRPVPTGDMHVALSEWAPPTDVQQNKRDQVSADLWKAVATRFA